MIKKIPEGFHTITPTLSVNDAAKAIKLYEKAFGAKEVYRVDAPGGTGKIMHACIKIGDSNIFISDVDPKMGSGIPSASSFYVYVDDVDTTFRQAEKSGLTETYPIQEMFWGDRMGAMVDSFGIQWTLATHVRDVSEEELEEAKKKFMKAA